MLEFNTQGFLENQETIYLNWLNQFIVFLNKEVEENKTYYYTDDNLCVIIISKNAFYYNFDYFNKFKPYLFLKDINQKDYLSIIQKTFKLFNNCLLKTFNLSNLDLNDINSMLLLEEHRKSDRLLLVKKFILNSIKQFNKDIDDGKNEIIYKSSNKEIILKYNFNTQKVKINISSLFFIDLYSYFIGDNFNKINIEEKYFIDRFDVLWFCDIIKRCLNESLKETKYYSNNFKYYIEDNNRVNTFFSDELYYIDRSGKAIVIDKNDLFGLNKD